MQVVKMLQALSAQALNEIHARRSAAIWASVSGLLRGRRLWLTHIGRHLGGDVSEKHSIKRVDRLLGNHHVYADRLQWYRWLTRWLIGTQQHPTVLVDWSNLDQRQGLYVLRAALPVSGRSIAIWEVVTSHYASTSIERQFLRDLAQILPPDCRPVLVTDAGFRTPWFKQVASMGWWYVGRIRHRHLVCAPGDSQWFSNKQFYAQASTRAKALGSYWIARSAPLQTRLYVYKGRRKGRVMYTAYGKPARGRHTEKPSAAAREPWLLASNLPPGSTTAKRVTALYRLRMQIEESFRDMKSTRNGLALRENLGKRPRRVAVLLLLNALATLALWLTGLAGERNGLTRGLQANTQRRTRVLSIIFVGTRLIERGCPFSPSQWRTAVDDLKIYVNSTAQFE